MMSTKELRKGFTPSFFSSEDIIASQARVPCRTEVPIKNFGFLDPSQESEDLPSGSNLELPLWAARAMSMQSRGFVAIKIPKNYNEKFSEILKADPVVVDLNKVGPQYYQTGLQICALPNGDADFIADALPDALQRRVAAINDGYSLNREKKSVDDATGSQESGATLKFQYMDPLEIEIYYNSKQASDALDKWLS